MTDYVAGGIANRFGDIWGTSPHRIIRHGRIVIDTARVGPALMCGWRVVPKTNPGFGECDPDFAWLERTAEERDAEGVKRGSPA